MPVGHKQTADSLDALEGEARGEDVGVVVGVEGGGGDLEAGPEDEGEAVAGGVAEVDLAHHEAG